MSSLRQKLERAGDSLPDPAAENAQQIAVLVSGDDRRAGAAQEKDVMLRYELRRIEIANTVTPTSITAIGALIAAAAGSRYGDSGSDFAGVLRGVALIIPLMASVYCLVILRISKSLWLSELLAAFRVFCYEILYNGGIGHAHNRYQVVTSQSDWAPATAEVAAIAWFMVWWVIQILVRYYLG